jgi:ABC-2 type transport system permease protein
MNGVAAVFYREYRQRITNIGWLFWDLCVPIAYLFLFGLGFEHALGAPFQVGGAMINYRTFLLAGVLAMTTFGIALNTSWTFFTDKDSGIFYELLTYPITRRQMLLGKISFNIFLSTLGSLLAIALGTIFMGVSVRWAMVPLTLLVVMGTTAGWFFFFSILAVRLRRMDSFNTMSSAAYILFMFLSSMFYPIDGLPGWFQWTANMNPMTWQVDVLRFTLIGTGSPANALIKIGAFAAFTLFGLTLAVRAVDRAG